MLNILPLLYGDFKNVADWSLLKKTCRKAFDVENCMTIKNYADSFSFAPYAGLEGAACGLRSNVPN